MKPVYLNASRLRFLLTLRKWPGYYDAFAKFDYLGGELDRMRNQRNPYRS